MEEILNKIVSKLDSLEKGQNELIMDVSGLKTDVGRLNSEVSCLKSDMKTGFDLVNKKLDTIYAQVAHNTEQEVRLNEVITRVDQLETDVKVIKKAISNQ